MAGLEAEAGFICNVGPRNGVFFRLANIKPGEASAPKLEDDSLYFPAVEIGDGMEPLETRMLEGKDDVVGVAGRTFTEV